jgi:hypothetical protein
MREVIFSHSFRLDSYDAITVHLNAIATHLNVLAQSALSPVKDWLELASSDKGRDFHNDREKCSVESNSCQAKASFSFSNR